MTKLYWPVDECDSVANFDNCNTAKEGTEFVTKFSTYNDLSLLPLPISRYCRLERFLSCGGIIPTNPDVERLNYLKFPKEQRYSASTKM